MREAMDGACARPSTDRDLEVSPLAATSLSARIMPGGGAAADLPLVEGFSKAGQLTPPTYGLRTPAASPQLTSAQDDGCARYDTQRQVVDRRRRPSGNLAKRSDQLTHSGQCEQQEESR